MSAINFFNLLGIALILFFMYGSVRLKKIDGKGAILGGVMSLYIFAGTLWTGLGLLFAFFVLGSAASKWKIKHKETMGFAEANKGQRSWQNAAANGGVAAICGLLAYFFPAYQSVLLLMLAGSFAAATADTLASELGNVYGTRYVNVLNFKEDKRGKDGVISAEGTLIGVVGAVLIALLYVAGTGNYGGIFPIVLAGIVGNWFDSVLGATWQQRGFLDNHMVNVGCTVVGAFVAGVVQVLV